MPDPVVPPSRWTRFTLPASAPRVRLVCLPCAGGGATAYRSWPRELAGASVDVWPVQLPGRENRFEENLPGSMEELVEELLDEFGSAFRTAPYALFGHSMGAHIALALAYGARSRGLPGPVRLFPSAGRPPNRPDPGPPAHNLPKAAFTERLRAYDAGSLLLREPELLDMFLPKLRDDFALFENYRPPGGEPLDCPFTVLGGLDDSSVPAALLPAWSAYTRGPFEVRLVAGGHLFLETARDAVVRLVRRRLVVPEAAG
ncbi:thioesterase II family protein [Actinomadura opuntiae]|uniref:thioesterase II family protein n=1 Tax=Actinomadura sp. OS1-43 TaxID=604315 RepID=UPI00255A8ECD|nr:alpha/beta fold hydrolase [Actinomadura sp. OS1-43]MDL4817190.1 alpha/beta fold hydrolase [Actinomadura sp. OS1-43]